MMAVGLNELWSETVEIEHNQCGPWWHRHLRYIIFVDVGVGTHDAQEPCRLGVVLKTQLLLFVAFYGTRIHPF